MRLGGFRRGFALLVILIGGAAPADRAAAADEPIRFELVEVIPPEIDAKGWTWGPEYVALSWEQGDAKFSWTPMPQSFDASGFRITLTVSAHRPNTSSLGPVLHTTFFGQDMDVRPSPGWAELNIAYTTGGTVSQELTVVPMLQEIQPGEIIVFHAGTDLGPGYKFHYRASGGTSTTTASGGPITAELADCPASIVISELPSLTCHLRISGFRHDTADPVEVILPSALDMQGNHGNGLQLPQTAGALDVSRMDDPHMWPVTLFACPGQRGAGVNCNGTGAAPGPLSVPIVVRQKDAGETQVMLAVTAVAGRNSATGTGSGESVTSTSVAAGPGQIGARIECPGTIVISALPSLNCHVIINGWLKDTAAPVRVLFPASIDEFGNHANGIQLVGQGEEDHFEWDNEDSHSWGFFVFACPGQSTTGANCYDSATTPGVQTVPLRVEQDGLTAADIQLVIDAQPHP